MQVHCTDSFGFPLPPTHTFPLAKYRMLRERAAALPEAAHARFVVPPAATRDELLLAHDADYIDAVLLGTLGRDAITRIGFPWSPAFVERSLRSCGGTLAAMRAAFVDGAALHLGGGTHHAGRARGAGFCVFNDSAVAALAALREFDLDRVLILDLDVHQGDGTAEILAEEPRVFTCSMHGARNFPRVKIPSDLDVDLPDGTGDEAYLAALQRTLSRAFDLARPGLVIYLAGADPFADDRFGRLALGKAGLARRDAAVLDAVVAARIPLVVTMAGGYGRHIEDTVEIQTETVRQTLALAAQLEPRPASAL